LSLFSSVFFKKIAVKVLSRRGVEIAEKIIVKLCVICASAAKDLKFTHPQSLSPRQPDRQPAGRVAATALGVSLDD
jgi:hypothetical protein